MVLWSGIGMPLITASALSSRSLSLRLKKLTGKGTKLLPVGTWKSTILMDLRQKTTRLPRERLSSTDVACTSVP